MTKSFRLEPALERDLEHAARAEGVPVSDFIRRAVRDRCAHVLSRTLKDELSDVIGAVAAPAALPRVTIAERTGAAFTDLLRAREARARSTRR